ncbi:hypothetical protein M514_11794 [Trichuris suis]|uniref:Uncharacterized protein n=1 Tax=Trichuris suis TaxID=68888 RepID=A0A085NJX8_9BILA|nr:hypothetical protein M514_11794 [Trichuris suis]
MQRQLRKNRRPRPDSISTSCRVCRPNHESTGCPPRDNEANRIRERVGNPTLSDNDNEMLPLHIGSAAPWIGNLIDPSKFSLHAHPILRRANRTTMTRKEGTADSSEPMEETRSPTASKLHAQPAVTANNICQSVSKESLLAPQLNDHNEKRRLQLGQVELMRRRSP